jgi:hypothetical protein
MMAVSRCVLGDHRWEDMTARNFRPRVATQQDLDAVVAILVSAFYDDPTWSWAFPDPSLRAEQHRRLWGLFVEGALRYPWVWLTPGNAATSVWIPPHGTELSDEQEAALEPTIVELLGGDASRVMHAFELFDREHPRDVPHFYLSLLGTSAQHRGNGYGLGLLAQNLRHTDEARMPSYLEASNPANVPLYRRQGFVVLGSFTLSEGGPEVFTMWRDAAPLG